MEQHLSLLHLILLLLVLLPPAGHLLVVPAVVVVLITAVSQVPVGIGLAREAGSLGPPCTDTFVGARRCDGGAP